ncbi:transporter [Salmonella enterica subsp. enterica]|uniref:Transporter n=1 Tax=Salmonella enterica I TaxID=59201 RepID=A0A447U4E1_SALET|nr:transporter [Salmonella enterica subsp. enterica]
MVVWSVFLFFGVLSDKFGRRAIILLGAVLYMLFFFGIPASPNLMIAFILAVCVGVANSALDTGGYPALMECFPKASGSAVILVKAMVSFWANDLPPYRQRLVSQPYLVRLRGGNPRYPFRPHHVDAVEKPFSQPTCRCQYCERITPDEQYSPRLAGRRSFRFIWRRRVSQTFYVIVVWMPKYAMAFAGMAESDALKTISYYSMGSLVCVFIFAALLKKMVRPIWANVFNAGLATLTAAAILPVSLSTDL